MAKKGVMPLCKKCGEHHWNLVPCSEVGNFNNRLRENLILNENKRRNTSKVFFRKPDEWGREDWASAPRATIGFHTNEFTERRSKWNTST